LADEYRQEGVDMVCKRMNEDGVTLIELTIIAVVISVLAAMAVPRWLEYLPQLRTKAAVREAVSALREARSLAIAQKVPYGVYFNVDKGACCLFANTADPANPLFSDADSVLTNEELGNGVHMGYTTFSNNCVIFDPSGAASSSGAIIMNSANYQSMYTVSVLQATGRVKLHNGAYDMAMQVR
jgi:Tfp pilus assembly protein FimT